MASNPTVPAGEPAPLAAADLLSLGLAGVLAELARRLDAPPRVTASLRGGGPGLSTAFADYRSAVDSYLHGDPVALEQLLERLADFHTTAVILAASAKQIGEFIAANPGSIRTVVTALADGRDHAADHRLVGVSDATSRGAGSSRRNGPGDKAGSNGRPSAG